MQSILVRLAKITADAQTRPEAIQQKRQLKQLFLPGLEDFMRAMPNHLARSSLFAPVARGRKRLHKETILVSRSDATIKYSGEQLDESQADVWMQAMHLAISRPLGEPIPVKRAEFLRAIGRQTGQFEYVWLHRSMQALTFAMLVIEVTSAGRPKLHIGRTRALHMIDGFDYDDNTQTYFLRIDPRWSDMYGNREFALIDWEKRKRFGLHQEMAKALQRLVATSDECTQRYSLEWLKPKLEYGGRMRDFVIALKRAMSELERLEIVIQARIENSTKGRLQAVWDRL